MINVTCADLSCGVEFGIPEHIERQSRRSPDRNVCCPNGHRFHYVEPEADRLKAQLERMTIERDDWKRVAGRREKSAIYWKGIAHRKRGAHA